jgi:hypothetical protein
MFRDKAACTSNAGPYSVLIDSARLLNPSARRGAAEP